MLLYLAHLTLVTLRAPFWHVFSRIDDVPQLRSTDGHFTLHGREVEEVGREGVRGGGSGWIREGGSKGGERGGIKGRWQGREGKGEHTIITLLVKTTPTSDLHIFFPCHVIT